MYQFQQGANAERVCGTKELFDFTSEAVEKLNPRKEIGGHSPVWVLRSQYEKCTVHHATYQFEASKDIKYKDGRFMKWPTDEIQKLLPEDYNKVDKHFVLEYREGDEIHGIKAPRSNRFYFVHDPNGGRLK